MKTAVNSRNPAKYRRSAEHFPSQRFSFQHFSSAHSPLFPHNPFFRASGPVIGTFNGLQPGIKFLAFAVLRRLRDDCLSPQPVAGQPAAGRA